MDILLPLRSPISTLPGLGPKLAALVAKLVGGGTVRDVLFHLPVDFHDRRATPKISEARPGSIATLRVEVIRHEPPARKSQPHRVIIGDGTGFAEIVLFHAARLVQFPMGARLVVSGKLERFNDVLVMAHPDYAVSQAQERDFPWIEPVWPLAAGVVPRIMRRAAWARWRGCRRSPNGTTRRCWPNEAGQASWRRCTRCTRLGSAGPSPRRAPGL